MSIASVRAIWGFPSPRSRLPCRPGSSAWSRRRFRTTLATTTTSACGCAPINGGSQTTWRSCRVATDKDDDNRRQDPEAAQRSGDRVSRNGAVVDPPARPRARGARVGEYRRDGLCRKCRTRSPRRRRSCRCRLGTTLSPEATPRSWRTCSRACSRRSRSRSSSSI